MGGEVFREGVPEKYWKRGKVGLRQSATPAARALARRSPGVTGLRSATLKFTSRSSGARASQRRRRGSWKEGVRGCGWGVAGAVARSSRGALCEEWWASRHAFLSSAPGAARVGLSAVWGAVCSGAGQRRGGDTDRQRGAVVARAVVGQESVGEDSALPLPCVSEGRR